MNQFQNGAVLIAPPSMGAAIEVLGAAEARWRAGVAAGATDAQAIAQALRQKGARAVLVLDDQQQAWLDTQHASGHVTGVSGADGALIAGRWTQFVVQGFVAADAALLAMWDEGQPLPLLSWGDAASVPVAKRAHTEGIYAIVDTVARLRQVLDAGITTVQLRIKQPADADPAWFAMLRRSLTDGIAAARDANATLFINDHWRLAAELGAGAVHLGQEDLGLLGAAGLLELAGADVALGVSSHAVWELCRARTLTPAYIACGPVWPKTTKDMPWRPQGLANLGWWCRQAHAPVVAIGGILTADLVRATARAGAAAVCVLRGLGDEPGQVVPALQDAFAQGRAEHDAAAAPRWPHPSLEPTA